MYPDSSDGKESASNAGDLGSIPGSENPLEEEMATHSSILAWRIPWTEEAGRVQSIGLQRVGQECAHAQYGGHPDEKKRMVSRKACGL